VRVIANLENPDVDQWSVASRVVGDPTDDCRHLGNGCAGGSRVSHMARGHVGSLFRESDRSSINEDVVAMA